MRRGRGFGLIELMLVLAVVAILAALTLPAYGAHAASMRRAAARVALVQAAQWLERAATATGRYPAAADIPAGLLQVEGGSYRLTAELQDGGFRLSAIPSGVQKGDRCGTLVLFQSGLRTISDDAPQAHVDACWSR